MREYPFRIIEVLLRNNSAQQTSAVSHCGMDRYSRYIKKLQNHVYIALSRLNQTLDFKCVSRGTLFGQEPLRTKPCVEGSQ